MRTSTYKIPAGERIEIGASGNYIQVRESVADLLIENPDKGEIVEVSQGDDVQLSDFNRLYITNTSAAEVTIKLTIARDKRAGSAKVGGSVSIAGAIALDAATLAAIGAALESVDLNAATLNKLIYQSYGASYRSTTNMAANTADQVFSAAANTNGAVIHSAQFFNYGATRGTAAFLAKATAPANTADGDAILSGVNSCFSAGNYELGANLINPLKIPAGKGLYFIPSIAEVTASRSVLYTLL